MLMHDLNAFYVYCTWGDPQCFHSITTCDDFCNISLGGKKHNVMEIKKNMVGNVYKM